MRALQPKAAHTLAHIEEKLHGETFLLQQKSELSHLKKPLNHFGCIGGKSQFVHHFLAQSAQATLLQQAANFVKTYLMFKITRVNHAAKVMFLIDN